ncbi:MAG: hypothetical protein ABIJ27_01180, partial [Candidatus Omnitrophota bacterium]
MVISVIIVWAFLFNTIFQGITSIDIAWAYGTGGSVSSFKTSDIGSDDLPFDLNTVELPANLGEIKEYYRSPDNGPVVINIQDAHCNYSCQGSIHKIMSYLRETYGIDTAVLEGGSG